MSENILFIILAIFAGIVVTLQGPINVKLGESLGNVYWASLITFIIGAICIYLFILTTGQKMPQLSSFNTSIWKYLGSITGVIYVLSVIAVIPKLGVGSATILLMFSQLLTSIVIDHFGLFGYAIKPIDLLRSLGVILMGLGILLINFKDIFGK